MEAEHQLKEIRMNPPFPFLEIWFKTALTILFNNASRKPPDTTLSSNSKNILEYHLKKEAIGRNLTRRAKINLIVYLIFLMLCSIHKVFKL